MKPELLVEVEGLDVSFGAHQVLSGLNLEIPSGQILAIVGPSGCGKTTLLRVLQGLVLPSAGSVRWQGEPSVAMVHQGSLLLPWRTNLDNASFGLECAGTPQPEARAQAKPMLERMGLGDRLHHHPHQISGGMRQRVDLARAMLLRPRLLLLDEPFNSLDRSMAHELQADLLELWGEGGLTIVLVSHDIDEVVRLADHVVLLQGDPATAGGLHQVDLPRPRGVGEEGVVALHRHVATLHQMTRAPRS
jgi:NitT/TauT family transport system ATP-binding protein